MVFTSRLGARFGANGARVLAGVVGVGLPALAWHQQRNKAQTEAATGNASGWLSREEFRAVKCVANEPHTHDTRKITFAPDGNPNQAESWNVVGPIANVLIRHGGPADASKCCSCCKCGADCACPVQANGCCNCCSCKAPCTCPKKEAANSKSVTRNYNPLSVERGYFGQSFTLLVKKYPGSKMGTALHALKPGDTVEAKGPNIQWAWSKGKYSEYGFVAGGTGITPIMQALHTILHHDTATVKLVCFNKSPSDVLLTQDLQSLQKAFGARLTITHVTEAGSVEGGRSGRVSSALLKELLPPPGAGVWVMCCGRADMTAAVAGPKNKDFTQGEVKGLLAELGYNSDHVWKL